MAVGDRVAAMVQIGVAISFLVISGVRSVAIAEGMPIDFDYREFRVARTNGAES